MATISNSTTSFRRRTADNIAGIPYPSIVEMAQGIGTMPAKRARFHLRASRCGAMPLEKSFPEA
jgi:hypothetical protein